MVRLACGARDSADPGPAPPDVAAAPAPVRGRHARPERRIHPRAALPSGWAWISLVLATPVALWGAWPFHRAAVANARHGVATMDTLISLGVTAAYAWSLVALVTGTGSTYLDVAAAVPVLILLGRDIEARAKRRSGAALRALLALGAKDVAVLRNGHEVRVPATQLAAGEEFVVRPGEKIAAEA
jgi:Cu+-exporting ATPase